MNRFWHSVWRLRIYRSLHQRRYDRQAAPEFLFERRSIIGSSVDLGSDSAAQSSPRATFRIVAANQPPHSATRVEEFVLRGADVPSLTVTSDPSNSIAIIGTGEPDWKVSYRARGEGNTEAEAQDRARAVSISVTGGTIALTNSQIEGHHSLSELLVKGPARAAAVVHASYASVKIVDMAGPVRVSATHARATVLDTSGQVDVTAGVIDFAASRGRVTLSAEAEINLRMRSTQFEGTLLAWAQRSVRLVLPPGFTTPIQAVVSRRGRFVCRGELASRVESARQGELHIFRIGDRTLAPVLRLRSEEAAVVIDSGSPGVADGPEPRRLYPS